MKKVLKIIIIIIILSLVGYGGYRILSGPSVKIKEKIEIKKYVESYLTKKYGKHKYKVTGIRYEYDMTTLFDYSNPTGYWVDFKSDIIPYSWITINGLNPNDYKVDNDYFIQSYYFPDQDRYNIHKTMDNMKPKKELETILLKELRDEFEPDAYEVECNTILLSIPEDYGKIPTLEELKTNTNLYKVIQFSYKVLNTIEDTNEYNERLKTYIANKYNSNSNIYFNSENTQVSVFLVD